MRTKILVSAILLLAILLGPVSSLLWAQTTDDADIEVLDPATGSDQAAQSTAAPWPVCRNGHWIRSAPGYPPVCAVQHIDNLIGPLAPCSFIVIGGVRYHIRRVVRTSNGWIISVARA